MARRIKVSDIKKIVATRSTSAFRLTSSSLTELTIEYTPRLSGSLVNSWTPNNGPVIARNVTIDQRNPSPPRVNFTQVVNTLKLGDTYSLGNGKPYGPRIEFEGWSRLKAPAGMLRRAVAQVQQFTDEAVRGSRT